MGAVAKLLRNDTVVKCKPETHMDETKENA